jgi:hypothetical protein
VADVVAGLVDELAARAAGFDEWARGAAVIAIQTYVLGR